jgi:hypothetical protein
VIRRPVTDHPLRAMTVKGCFHTGTPACTDTGMPPGGAGRTVSRIEHAALTRMPHTRPQQRMNPGYGASI